jgi:MFS family permease
VTIGKGRKIGTLAAAIGISSGLTILGFGMGPLVGGVLLEHFWWGSVFLVNVPVVVVMVIAGALILPESKNPSPGRIDVLSVLLSVVGMVGVVYTIKEVAYKGWGHGDVAVAAVLGLGSLLAFALRQPRLAEPLMDLKLFTQRAFSATIGTTLVAMFAQLAVSVLFAQYMQLVLGWSPLKSGLAGLPGMGGAIVGGAVQVAAQLPPEQGALVLDSAKLAFVDGLQLTMLCSAGLMALLAISAMFSLRGVPKTLEDPEDEEIPAPAHASV